jgi:antitoxin (DNA-binding transcriptional repressor) of toxin-antitoxin stability system
MLMQHAHMRMRLTCMCHTHPQEMETAICVDCGWRATTENFLDQGGRGIFCANKNECMARLVPKGSRRKSTESTGTQEVVKVTKGALLRLLPVLTSLNNGVEVEEGEEVTVLDRQSDDDTSFLHVQTQRRKKGWIRSAYVTVL